MREHLSDHDRRRLDARVAGTEKSTGTQIVLSVIQRSDSYVELPWKAFALGASVAGLVLLVLSWRFNAWYPDVPLLFMVVGMLSCGALLALLSVMMPRFAKWFLSDYRAEVEVEQYAQSLFLERQLFDTRNRSGILLLVSLFEHRVVILPDKGLDRLQEEDIQNMIAAMTPLLKRQQIAAAFDAGLDYLSDKLAVTSPGAHDDELPNEIIEEKGI